MTKGEEIMKFFMPVTGDKQGCANAIDFTIAEARKEMAEEIIGDMDKSKL